jgi:hypothetical protein
MTTAKRKNSDFFFPRRFHCLILDPSKSALLLDSSRLRTRSFSSSCVRMCGYGTKDLLWETCGSVDAGGSGEPEVDSPSSSSSESMVNSVGGSGTEIPSPCGTGRIVYSDTLLPTSFSSWCLQKLVATYRSSNQLRDYLAPSKPQKQQTASHVFFHSATAEDLLHIYGSICAGPRICLGRRSCIRNTNDTPFPLSR